MQNYSSRYSGIPNFDPALSHRIDAICLAILFISMFSCLIRSDFNFAIVFFCYFIWQNKKDGQSAKYILAMLVISFIFDILFALIQIRVWVQDDPKNSIWGTLSGMHNFGIVCFVLVLILKIALAVFVFKANSEASKAVSYR